MSRARVACLEFSVPNFANWYFSFEFGISFFKSFFFPSLSLLFRSLTKERRKNSSPGGLVTAIIRVTALGKKCRKNSLCVFVKVDQQQFYGNYVSNDVMTSFNQFIDCHAPPPIQLQQNAFRLGSPAVNYIGCLHTLETS